MLFKDYKSSLIVRLLMSTGLMYRCYIDITCVACVQRVSATK